MIKNIKRIEKYNCDNFEEWELDDPAAEGYFGEYENIKGASPGDLSYFEKKYKLVLPDDFKELYKYKNGSKFFSLFPLVIDGSDMSFCLMSLQEMDEIKKYFQNRDALLSEFPDYFTEQEIAQMADSRIKPYLFNKSWFPFAQYCDSCYLMLDFDPDCDGKSGQIICYSHDPDKVVYVAPTILNLISQIGARR